MHCAAHRDDLDAADLLIRAGADVEATNRSGVAPLALACLNGNAAMIETLLDAGADPNATQPGGETALMTASRTGRVAAVQVLLDRGANPNAQESSKGQTALMWAAAENNAAVLRALIDAGARLDVENGEGWTPLRIADGVAITASIHISADAADTLRRLRTERGLPVPEPIIGVAK